MKTAAKPIQTKRQPAIVIALVAMIALVLVAMGALSIMTEEHSGATRRGIVHFSGSTAQWMGAFEVCLGMIALSLAMRTRTAAMRWMGFWILCGVVAVVMGWRANT